MFDEDFVDMAVIWFVSGKKSGVFKNHIHVSQIMKYIIDDDVSSIYIEKNCKLEDNVNDI